MSNRRTSPSRAPPAARIERSTSPAVRARVDDHGQVALDRREPRDRPDLDRGRRPARQAAHSDGPRRSPARRAGRGCRGGPGGARRSRPRSAPALLPDGAATRMEDRRVGQRASRSAASNPSRVASSSTMPFASSTSQGCGAPVPGRRPARAGQGEAEPPPFVDRAGRLVVAVALADLEDRDVVAALGRFRSMTSRRLPISSWRRTA